MANRTFKIFGSAYAPSGSVSVTVTVDGTQRFSGEVTTSATPRDGQPSTQSELISFTMDDSDTSGIITFDQDSTGTSPFVLSTFGDGRYQTLFDSENSADSAHYPFQHV